MEHFSAVKFDMVDEKKMSFLVIPKSPKVWKKNLKIRMGFLKMLVCCVYHRDALKHSIHSQSSLVSNNSCVVLLGEVLFG